ncbi:MAG: hypothetical protein NTY80_01000 [candidate division SR1 bacterium]|nr:hypothetical protein [candidate division SR1 bacterium]
MLLYINIASKQQKVRIGNNNDKGFNQTPCKNNSSKKTESAQTNHTTICSKTLRYLCGLQSRKKRSQLARAKKMGSIIMYYFFKI